MTARARLVAALVVTLLGCGRRGSPEPPGDPPAEPRAGARVRFELRLPGDDIGGAEDRADLEAILAGIRARGAGEPVGREFGMGRMGAVIEVRGTAPLAAIRAAVEQVRPGAAPRIAVVAAGGGEPRR